MRKGGEGGEGGERWGRKKGSGGEEREGLIGKTEGFLFSLIVNNLSHPHRKEPIRICMGKTVVI